MYRGRSVVPLLALVMFLSAISLNSHISFPHIAVNSPFRLPVLPGVTVTVTQGNNMVGPGWDHSGLSAYAFDFAVGTSHFVVTAAQGGKVIGVDDSSTLQCDGLNHEAGTPPDATYPGCWTHGNYILILDDDGKTAALYLHLLTHSAKVRVGYHVKQGDQLAIADTTGYALGNPHLHFQVEKIPVPAEQEAMNLPLWWTQSVPVAFSNPEISAKPESSDGVPVTGEVIPLSGKTPPTQNILPGGLWISPNDGQVVSDTVHFAAYAYPTHPSDPAIARVNFTIGLQGNWKVACTVVPPSPSATPTPVPVPTPTPPSLPANAQKYTCDANLKDLGVSNGQIQVSFDVYDQAGNVNLAPNGVHMLTYKPSPPKLVASPTYINIFQQYQGGGICAHTNSQDGYICTILLSSPSSNQVNINWSAISSDCSDVCFNPTPSNGTLSPGQQINVVVNFGCAGIQNGIDRRESITFTGGVNPVMVQLICE